MMMITLICCIALPLVAEGFTVVPDPRSISSSLQMNSVFHHRFESSPDEGRGLFRKPSEDDDLSESPYLEGDELYRLRQQVLQMRSSLQEARALQDTNRIQRLSRAILTAQQLDAEFMYEVSVERTKAAAQASLLEEAERYRQEAEAARAALPQFQLEGLWVGKYGDTFQMVNVSYVGDILVAHKVTGQENEQHVPKGEISFQVDLSPKVDRTLNPLELAPEAAEQWGSKYLQRHTGLGQVASTGYVDSQWLEGQMILVNQHYFSFAWMPTGHQVFFGRPSPELTLKLLRGETVPATNKVEPMDSDRKYLERCYEETEYLDDDMEVSESLFTTHDQAFYFAKEGCFE